MNKINTESSSIKSKNQDYLKLSFSEEIAEIDRQIEWLNKINPYQKSLKNLVL